MFADAYLEEYSHRWQYNGTYNFDEFHKLLPSFFVFAVELPLREGDWMQAP